MKIYIKRSMYEVLENGRPVIADKFILRPIAEQSPQYAMLYNKLTGDMSKVEVGCRA